MAAVVGLPAELFTGLYCISLLSLLVRVVIPSYFIQRKLEKAGEKVRPAAGSKTAQPPKSIAVQRSSYGFKVEKLEEKGENQPSHRRCRFSRKTVCILSIRLQWKTIRSFL